MVHERADPKVDEDDLIVVVDHDIVRLDISVNDFDDFVAVVKRFKHVDEVEVHTVLIEPHLLDFFFSALSDTLFLLFVVDFQQLIAQTDYLSNDTQSQDKHSLFWDHL